MKNKSVVLIGGTGAYDKLVDLHGKPDRDHEVEESISIWNRKEGRPYILFIYCPILDDSRIFPERVGDHMEYTKRGSTLYIDYKDITIDFSFLNNDRDENILIR